MENQRSSIFTGRVIEGTKTELTLKPFVIFRTPKELAKHYKMKERKIKALIGKMFCPISYVNKNGEEILFGYASMVEMARYGAAYLAEAPEWLDVRLKSETENEKKKPRYSKYFFSDGRPKYLIMEDDKWEKFVRKVGVLETKDIPKFKLLEKAHYGRALDWLWVRIDGVQNSADREEEEETEDKKKGVFEKKNEREKDRLPTKESW